MKGIHTFMNKIYFTEKHPIIISIIYSLLVLVFPIIAGVITTINQSNTEQTILVQGICFMFAAITAFVIMKRSRYSLKEYGFQASNNNKQILYYIPMILIELTSIFTGLRDGITLPYILNVLYFTLMVGICEEVFYRGLMLKTLSIKGSKYAVIAGSIIFGITHLGNLAGGANMTYTILQVVFATLFGFVCAELVIITRSIIYVIFFHFLHDFIAYISVDSLNRTIDYVILGIQMVLLLLYAVYLWFKISEEKMEVEIR